MQYTREQVLHMAPDDASAKAGQQLANSSKWTVKCISDTALWGDCQGSGKNPYKTIVDLTNIAFKCSCPSRKFPCKHGIGLMLLYTQQADVFSTATDIPEHVTEWLAKRQEKEVAKEQKEAKPVDAAAQAKRATARKKKVDAGIGELRIWIRDVVRAGIMNIPQQSHQFYLNITARMVDAQAGGLAAQLRQINTINFYTEGWQRMLLRRLAALYLITEAYQRIDDLPEAMAQELQTLIGWTTAKEEVLQSQPVSGTWAVLSVTMEEEGNIVTERSWLYNKSDGRFALLLNFYAGNQVPQALLVPGAHITADVVYFPGIHPLRALIKEQHSLPHSHIDITAGHSLRSMYHELSAGLTENPFKEQVPFVLNEVYIHVTEATWLLSDGDNDGIALSNTTETCWQMLAFTKGKTCSCFGVYERDHFQILSLWADHKTYFVK
ncbi:hypothetical protein B0I18_11197 [Taibaiella chishuiensis]|uniref:SWIM-type domain-containing protein n=2 Tax=Taibaiella chishuiensis TaxID=1434707 RepID=A0A2P8CX39_9BACT|nr:hypothetical protein B0I18_11197 [Taibaiella chishuiensis]